MSSNNFYTSFNFIIVGCGGTGGNYIKEFCRFVSSLDKKQKQKINICLVDGDIVEAKNIERQPFLEEDINKNKATALSEICGDIFGLTIFAYPHYITTELQIDEILKGMPSNSAPLTVIIGCVDNHRARQVLHTYFNKHKSVLYLDSANEFSNGEVVFGCKYEGQILSQPRGYFFPEVLTDLSPDREEISCEELNNVAGQHIVTNIMAANILLSASAKLIKNGDIPMGIVFFDAFDFSMRLRIAEEEVGDIE